MFQNANKSSLINNLVIKRLINTETTVSNTVKPILTNRNPRNLEKLRIAYKPDGYHLEKPGKCYWHKLELSTTSRHVTATITHFQNGPVLTASTKEWAIKKHLYRNTDVSAFINLGRVLAQRCLETGLTEIRCDIKPESEKMSGFLNALTEGGVTLQEPAQFKAIRPWDKLRPEKPWEVTE